MISLKKNLTRDLISRWSKKLFFGLHHKMLLSFSLVIIISIISISYFSADTFSKFLETNNTNYCNQVLGNLEKNLEFYVDGLYNITDLAEYNHYIQSYLIKQNNVNPTLDSEAFQLSMELLGSYVYTRKDISSIMVFSKKSLALCKTTSLNTINNFNYKTENWYARAFENVKSPVITGPHTPSYIPESKDKVFSVSRVINGYDGSGPIGLILIDSNFRVINDLCASAKLLGNGYILITDKEGNIIYHPEGSALNDRKGLSWQNDVLKTIFPNLQNSNSGVFISLIGKEKQQFVFKKMGIADWTIIAVTPYKEMITDAQKIRTIIIFAGIICLVIFTAIVYYLSKRFTTPIQTLSKIMDQAEHGNLNVRSHMKTNDEINMLSESFNNLLERIDILMKQVVADQEAKRKSDLNVLQSQINPHFLYNALDSIIWMTASNNKNTIKMVEALSRFFRLSLSRGQDLITLSDELDHARNYLIIQGIRYQNKIDFNITCEEELLNYKTLKIILQPLIENSIYHGIKNKEGKGTIDISARKSENSIIVTIKDDGAGMDEKTCSEILQGTYERQLTGSSGIGVRNVNSRIKLYFGNEYGLSFKSELGIGTTVCVTLPLIKG